MTAADDATALALAARSGDSGAQAAFVRRTQAEVWRFCAALVDPGAADDLTQETYLRAFKALPGFEGLSYAQAAAVEEVPVGTIRSRVARARNLVAAVAQARAS